MIKSSYVINYYDEAGYVEDNFIDANAKGLVSSPVGAMTFDTMEDAQFWIDTQAADNLFDPEYCEIQPVDDEIESACHGKSKKAKKSVKSGRYIKSGAGAGYDVTIEGLELDVDNFKVLERDDESIHVQVPVKPCVVDKWKAADYYNSVSSDGIEIDYIPVMEYGNDDKKVDSGYVNITIDIWENDDYSTDESIRDTLPSSIDFTASYGWGWTHSNLPDDGMHFDYESIKEPDIGAYGEMHLDEIDLKCPNISENINWFFAHDHELEEIFFGDENEVDDTWMDENPDEEIVNSCKPLKSAHPFEKPYEDLETGKHQGKMWRGVPEVEMIWHGEWADPELEYNGVRRNIYDVEDAMRMWAEEDGINAENDEEFNKYCQEHSYDVYEMFDE